MTANQRRPGFRLPWSPEEGNPPATPEKPAAPETMTDAAQAPDATQAPEATGVAEPPEAPEESEAPKAPVAADAAAPADVETAAGTDDATPDFMRDLVEAMRKVADEARQAGVTDLRGRADQQIIRLEADAEQRRDELRTRAEVDIAGVAEWASSEAERIRAEAEQRAAARRTQLEQQLAAEATRSQGEASALRDRVGAYERELDAFYAQLTEIGDPAAFAAAAKRIPRPPQLDAGSTAGTARQAVPQDAPSEPGSATADVEPAEEEVLATRLAELDEELATEPNRNGIEATTTEIVVKGLGSFGAITGFRQALADVDGIEGVALSLGQSGEFVFRATHRTGFDPAAAIVSLEGDAATAEKQPNGALVVTLDRAR